MRDVRPVAVRALIAAGALAQADAELNDTLRCGPRVPDLLYLRGVVANKLNDSERARGFLRAATSAVPTWCRRGFVANIAHEMIVIRDAVSLAAAYNRALRRATGDHVEPAPPPFYEASFTSAAHVRRSIRA